MVITVTSFSVSLSAITTESRSFVTFVKFVVALVSVVALVACRLTLQPVHNRVAVAMRASLDSLYRMAQLCHFATELAHLPLQGLSDVGPPLRHVILTQVHVLLPVVRHQAIHGKVAISYPVVAEVADLQRLTNQFAAIGNNLNQIARYFNMGGLQSKAIREEINGCVAEIMKLRKAVLEMAGDFHGGAETPIE